MRIIRDSLALGGGRAGREKKELTGADGLGRVGASLYGAAFAAAAAIFDNRIMQSG